MNCTGEYVIDDADHDGAILFRFLSTRFREKAAQSSQGSYGSKPVLKSTDDSIQAARNQLVFTHTRVSPTFRERVSECQPC